MSELIQTRRGSGDFRWQLLTTVSALTLLAGLGVQAAKAADDADRPTVWIELGGQLERASSFSDPFVPNFLSKNADNPGFAPISLVGAQHTPRYAKGAEGKITFQPENSDWVFSAGIRYGRANGNKHIHQQTPGKPLPPSALVNSIPGWENPPIKLFSDLKSRNSETHTVLDFQAGKDVGLGGLGQGGSSTVSLGVRYAQFSSSTDVQLKGRSDIFVGQTDVGGGFMFDGVKYWFAYTGISHSERSFRGVGPSLSWDGSAALAGDSDTGEVTFDWGLKGALLFGRQKAQIDHQTTSQRYYGAKNPTYQVIYARHPVASRSRSITVPNIGGFAGLSMRYTTVKFSMGYRGDIFIGASDIGIDARNSANRSFHGPFATISIGLGG